MQFIFAHYWLIVAAGWYGINGILHDVFVIKSHKGTYDRELLRLLIDGHVVLLSAVLLTAAWWMMRAGNTAAPLVGIIVAAGMLVYCALIFPFLKSFGTIGISLALLIVYTIMLVKSGAIASAMH